MSDVVEVSYTGDLLAHRRCARAWAYEKYAGFRAYEEVQAMEGRLIHNAMEWLARRLRETGHHPSVSELRTQLERQFRVLWARGFRTAFTSKTQTIDRVQANLFPSGVMDRIVRAAVEGAVHTEYELRTVKKLIKGDFAGKTRMLLTGVLDVVVQQKDSVVYRRMWRWTSTERLQGEVVRCQVSTGERDLEIWDYKATRATSAYKTDYVRQLLTYAALYRDRTGTVPKRCVVFFVNEPAGPERLLFIPMDAALADSAVAWTTEQVQELRRTARQFEKDPGSIEGGSLHLRGASVGRRTDDELARQCTACGRRFDCGEYQAYLGRPGHPDVRLDNVKKN